MKGYYGAYEGFEKILFNYKRPPMGGRLDPWEKKFSVPKNAEPALNWLLTCCLKDSNSVSTAIMMDWSQID